MPVRNAITPEQAKHGMQGEVDKRTPAEIEADFWADAKKRNAEIESVAEEEVFHLTPLEAQKCRFALPDKNTRMAACTVHTNKISHGVRLFPPHLWDWRDGLIFQKVNGEWKLWTADVKQNIQRLDDIDK